MYILKTWNIIKSFHNLSFSYRCRLLLKTAISRLRRRETKNIKIVAVIAVKNEEKYLQNFFLHLRNYVDGFIVLDDGSTDSSIDIINKEPKVKNILKNNHFPGKTWDEIGNRKRLLQEALKYGNVVLCCDADERFSLSFLNKLNDLKEIAFYNPNAVFGVRLRELWDQPNQYRCDGIWDQKTKYILFSLIPSMTFSKTMTQEHHIPWFHDKIKKHILLEDNLFHLKMIYKQNREERYHLYEKLDPTHKMQKIGYAYLIDESNIKLHKISNTEFDQRFI